MSAKKDTVNPELIAYVHDVSPVKRNRKNTTDYSTLRLQLDEATGSKEALCFSKIKRKLLVEREQTRTAVKVSRYTYTAGKEKLIINDFTQLSAVNELEHSFQYKEAKLDETVSTLEEVKKETHEQENINVMGKIVKIFPTKTVGKANEWKVASAVIADSTGRMDIEFWNDYIPKVKVGSSYRFLNLKKRIWKDVAKLTTGFSTRIDESPEGDISFKDLNDEEAEEETSGENTVEVSAIEAVESVTKYKRCLRCSRRILQPTQKVVKCDHCGNSMRLDRCTTSIYAVVVIEVGDGKKKLQQVTIFEDILKQLIDVVGIKIDDIDTQLVIEKLLFLSNLKVTFNDRNIVTCVELVH